MADDDFVTFFSLVFLPAGLLSLVVIRLSKPIYHVLLLVDRLAFTAFARLTGARFVPVDPCAAGDHVGVRRAHRRLRFAIRHGFVGNAALIWCFGRQCKWPSGPFAFINVIFEAVAQSCRRYYRD